MCQTQVYRATHLIMVLELGMTIKMIQRATYLFNKMVLEKG